MTNDPRFDGTTDDIEGIAGPHLSSDEIEGFLSDGAVDRERIELHRIWCNACDSRIHRVARLLAQEPVPELAPLGRTAWLGTFRPWQFAVAGALAVAAMIIALQLFRRQPQTSGDLMARNDQPAVPEVSSPRTIPTENPPPTPPAIDIPAEPPRAAPIRPASKPGSAPAPAASPEANPGASSPGTETAPARPPASDSAPAPAPLTPSEPADTTVAVVVPDATNMRGIAARSVDELSVDVMRQTRTVTFQVSVAARSESHTVTFELVRSGTTLWMDSIVVAPGATTATAAVPAQYLEIGLSYQIRYTDRPADGSVLRTETVRIAVTEKH